MLQIYEQLRWHPEGNYQLLNGAVERQWDWQKNHLPPESITALRLDLAVDPICAYLSRTAFTTPPQPIFRRK
jgi:hypothetical protein